MTDTMEARRALVAHRARQDRLNAEATGELATVLTGLQWRGDRRVLRAPDLPAESWPAIVACLNIWMDTPALRETMASWVSQVDAVVVADGPYHAGHGPSTDGLDEVLAKLSIPVIRVPWTGAQWPDQPTKRTALLQTAAHAYPGALLVVVDADETITGDLRASPVADVLWCDVTSPLYQRPMSQPRGFRARPDLAYKGRHHWLHTGETLLATHQYGGTGVLHDRLPVILHNARGLAHTPARRQMKHQILRAQYEREQGARTTVGAASDRRATKREALRILQTTHYDAGLVGYRLHTAINATTPHVSAFGSAHQRNTFGAPVQYAMDQNDDHLRLTELLRTADVLHCHLDYAGLYRLGRQQFPWTVIHHHGTMYRTAAYLFNQQDAVNAGLRLVSNLELLQCGENLHFLPNPVPVAWYRRLRVPHGTGAFRVAHSPSRRALKATDTFLRACDRLQRDGLAIEPVLIEGRSHAESLTIKGTCDAAFDSFWLGMQCSGLEAAAMGLPVIAGDTDCLREYTDWLGEAPYTFANTEDQLVEQLARLATDRVFYDAEAARVSGYVVTHHDEAAVALRYLDLLDEAFQWRQVMGERAA